jgi:hypothetical protein
MAGVGGLQFAGLFFLPPALVIIPARHVAIFICIDTATIDARHTVALHVDAA